MNAQRRHPSRSSSSIRRCSSPPAHRLCALVLSSWSLCCATSSPSYLRARATLRRSPVELEQLSFALHVSAKTEPYWEKRGVRRAVEAAVSRELATSLQEAGLARGHLATTPRISIRVSMRLFGTASRVRSRLTLEILDEDRTLQHLTLEIPSPGRSLELIDFPKEAAIRIANAVTTSERVRELVLARRRMPATTPAITPTSSHVSPTVVAVLDTLDRGGHDLADATSNPIADLIAVRIGEQKRYRVVLRDRVRELARAAKAASYAPHVDDRSPIALGRALAADKLVVSEIFRIGEGCVLTAEIINLETEVSERAASVTSSCAQEALLGHTERIVSQLVE